MENPIFQLYHKTDDMIMYGVNKGVKAWNWTTGQTKTDLANSMLTIAPIFEGVGCFSAHPLIGLLCTPFYLGLSHKFQKRNVEQEIEEAKVAEKRVKLSLDSEYERDNKTIGLGFVAIGGYDFTPPALEILGIGNCIRGSSHYVMRADYLPPRKSLFRRVKDKLVDKLNEGNLVPEIV